MCPAYPTTAGHIGSGSGARSSAWSAPSSRSLRGVSISRRTRIPEARQTAQHAASLSDGRAACTPPAAARARSPIARAPPPGRTSSAVVVQPRGGYDADHELIRRPEPIRRRGQSRRGGTYGRSPALAGRAPIREEGNLALSGFVRPQATRGRRTPARPAGGASADEPSGRQSVTIRYWRFPRLFMKAGTRS